jgi:preprotein translocase subunit SecD
MTVSDLESELRGGLIDAANLLTISADPWGDYQRRTTPAPRRPRLAIGFAVAGIVAATAGIVVVAIVLTAGGASRHPTAIDGSRPVVLTPRHALSAGELKESASIIRSRLNDAGIGRSTVAVTGQTLQIVASASATSAVIAAVASRGELRFRQALAFSSPGPAVSTSTTAVAVRGPAESPTLDKTFEQLFAEWDCTDPADQNATRGDDEPADFIIACGNKADGFTKYLLAPAAVEGTALSSASAEFATTNQWQVDLTFTASGANAWQKLTAKAYAVNNGHPDQTCSPPKGCNAVAMVVDGSVLSAPFITSAGGISAGVAQISGGLTRQSADQLADVLRFGALPTSFSVSRGK